MVSRPSRMDVLAGEFRVEASTGKRSVGEGCGENSKRKGLVGRLGDTLALSGNAKSFSHELVSKCLSLRQMSLSVST